MPAYGFLTRGWYTNTVGLAAYRGPWAMESLIRETALDIAARKIGIDPIEIRRRNLVTAKDQPTDIVHGYSARGHHAGRVPRKTARVLRRRRISQGAGSRAQEGRYLGLGIATYIEPTGSAGSIATMTGELAQVRIEPTGKVTAIMSTHSQGHGTATTMAQIIAERLGVAYEDVTVFEGDSSRGGFSPGAAGSRQGVIAGGAAIKASDLLADKVKVLAAHLLDVAPEAIRIEDGMVHVNGAPEKSRTLRAIAEIAYGEPDPSAARLRVRPGGAIPLPAAADDLHQRRQCLRGRSERETGFVKILRWISAEDCGTPINPAVVEGQIAGGWPRPSVRCCWRRCRSTRAAIQLRRPTRTISCRRFPTFRYSNSSTPTRRRKRWAACAVSARAARSSGRRRWSTPLPTRWPIFGESPWMLPLTPVKLLSVIEGRDIAGSHRLMLHQIARYSSDRSPRHQPWSLRYRGAGRCNRRACPWTNSLIDGDWKMVMSTPMGPQEMTGSFRNRRTIAQRLPEQPGRSADPSPARWKATA
jgi:carbon-monoxide dehydrogenase large subunit